MKAAISLTIVTAMLLFVSQVNADCLHKKTNHRFAAGTVYNPIGECNTYKCGPDGTMSALTCPEFQPRPGCKKSEHDLTKAYPDCCPTEVC